MTPKGRGTIHRTLAILESARQHASRSAQVQGDGAILLAAATVESFLNELPFVFHSAATIRGREGTRDSAVLLEEAEKEHASLAFRLALAHYLLSGRSLDRGSQPYQDIALLFRLRNLLVHPRPEPLVIPESAEEQLDHDALVKAFVGRGIIDSPTFNYGNWSVHLLVPSVANWAVETAFRAIKWLAMLPADSDLRGIMDIMTAYTK